MKYWYIVVLDFIAGKVIKHRVNAEKYIDAEDYMVQSGYDLDNTQWMASPEPIEEVTQNE